MRVTFTDVVPVDKEILFQWWTDYADEDHEHWTIPGVYRVHRRVVEREDGDRIVLEDHETFLGSRTTTRSTILLRGNDRIDVEATMPYGTQRQTYWFEDVPGGGTRITHTMDLEPAGPWARVAPIVAPMARAGIAWDMRHHIEAFLREHPPAPMPSAAALGGHATAVWGPRQYGR